METYHEGTYRCSRIGHADCCPDARSARERGPDVPGELLIRVQRLLTDDKPDQQPKVSDRAYRHEPAPSVTDIGLTVCSSQTSSFTAAFRGDGYPDLPNEEVSDELFLQAPYLEFSLLPAGDTSPGARN
jgi:hypothetical protein